MQQSRWLSTAIWANFAMMGVVLVVLLTRNDTPTLIPAAYGQPAQQPIAGGAGLFLMPGQFSSNTWGCYVMDVDSQTLCAYQFLPGEKQLRLIAARNFRFDRKLGNFNTTPAPNDVKDLLDKEQQVNHGAGAGN